MKISSVLLRTKEELVAEMKPKRLSIDMPEFMHDYSDELMAAFGCPTKNELIRRMIMDLHGQMILALEGHETLMRHVESQRLVPYFGMMHELRQRLKSIEEKAKSKS